MLSFILITTLTVIEGWRQPGPLYNFDGALSVRGSYSAPRYSMRKRMDDPFYKDQGFPSAMAYSPSKQPTTSAPAYSLSPKFKIVKSKTVIPAANTYKLPDTLGSSGKVYSGRTSPIQSMACTMTHGNAYLCRFICHYSNLFLSLYILLIFYMYVYVCIKTLY